MTEKRSADNCPPSDGNRPPGQSIPLIVVGPKFAGVQPPTCRSKVSVWLGAPGSITKMQYLAVFRIVGCEAEPADCGNISIGDMKYPVSPVAATLKKMRRSITDFIGASVIENEFEFVQQDPLHALRAASQAELLKHWPIKLHFRICGGA